MVALPGVLHIPKHVAMGNAESGGPAAAGLQDITGNSANHGRSGDRTLWSLRRRQGRDGRCGPETCTMLDAYLEFLELAYFEVKFAFEGLANENVWKRPAAGLLPVGELAGHIAYWEAVRLAAIASGRTRIRRSAGCEAR